MNRLSLQNKLDPAVGLLQWTLAPILHTYDQETKINNTSNQFLLLIPTFFSYHTSK